MKATIDIKTPAGQSLKGFPVETSLNKHFMEAGDILDAILTDVDLDEPLIVNLHAGDTVTIKITE